MLMVFLFLGASRLVGSRLFAVALLASGKQELQQCFNPSRSFRCPIKIVKELIIVQPKHSRSGLCSEKNVCTTASQ